MNLEVLQSGWWDGHSSWPCGSMEGSALSSFEAVVSPTSGSFLTYTWWKILSWALNGKSLQVSGIFFLCNSLLVSLGSRHCPFCSRSLPVSGWVLLPAPQPGNFLKAVRTLLYFPSFRDHLKGHCLIHSALKPLFHVVCAFWVTLGKESGHSTNTRSVYSKIGILES